MQLWLKVLNILSIIIYFNYYLIFSAKKFIYDTAIAVNYSIAVNYFKNSLNLRIMPMTQ